MNLGMELDSELNFAALCLLLIRFFICYDGVTCGQSETRFLVMLYHILKISELRMTNH